MTALTATFSTVNSQCWRNWFERMCPATSSGLRLVCASISCDLLFRGQNDRQLVGPVVIEKQRDADSLRCPASTSRGVARSIFDFFDPIALGGTGEAFDDLLHDRPSADRALAVDVGA